MQWLVEVGRGISRRGLLLGSCMSSSMFKPVFETDNVARYERISFHTHQLIIEDGVKSWRLETFS